MRSIRFFGLNIFNALHIDLWVFYGCSSHQDVSRGSLIRLPL